MVPFLAEARCVTSRLPAMEEVAEFAAAADDAIISLGLASDTEASAEQELRAVRSPAPGLKLVFASLLKFDAAFPSLARLVREAHVLASVIDAGTPTTLSGLGHSDTFVYVAKTDLDDPARRLNVVRVLRRHFR